MLATFYSNYGSYKKGQSIPVAAEGKDWVMTTSGRYIPKWVCYIPFSV